MSSKPIHNSPIRITNLIELKRHGASVTCSPSFQIIPVDFTHRTSRFRAVVFLCRFSGTVDGRVYAFRKCYARGCADDMCPRVSQAVMIANRYLQRDYRRLREGLIEVEEKLFRLEESVARLMDMREDPGQTMVIDDYIRAARCGEKVGVGVVLEYVPATEHFEYHKNLQTFLMADFAVTIGSRTAVCQRCLGCYPTGRENEERRVQIHVANDRLALLYREFDLSFVEYEKRFFG